MSANVLGMLGPISLADFREHLHAGVWRDDLPRGLGGTPVNLLTRELLRRGRRVVLFSLDPAVSDEIVLDGPSLRICIGPFRPKRARDFFAAERAYLRRAIVRERPRLLHAQWTYEYAMAAQASGLPHVITAHDAPLNVLRLNPIPYRVARTLMAYRVLSRARRVVAVAPHVERHLRRFMFFRGGAEVIPNGMPDSLFARRGAREGSAGGLTFASVLVGWGGLKNGQTAIEAFARVRQDLPGARFLMFGAGHGPGEPALAWARRRGLDSGIEFAGQTPHERMIGRVAAEVDALVHPALEEAQPMALIEAMALGIPVIAGESSGGVPWTLDGGRAGLLVDVRSPAEIAAAMLRLARDEAERRMWAERGFSLAQRRFHIRAVADAYERVYDELARAA